MEGKEKEQGYAIEEEAEKIQAQPLDAWPEAENEAEPKPVQEKDDKNTAALIKKEKKKQIPTKKILPMKRKIKPKVQKQIVKTEVKMKKHRTNPKKQRKSPKKKFMIKTAHLVFLVIVLILAIIAVSFLVGNLPGAKDTVLVKINNETITKNQIEKRYSEVPIQMRASTTKEAILNKMVEEILLYQETKKQGIEITDADADKYLSARLSEIGMTQEQLNNQLKETNTTMPEFREAVRKEIAIQQLLNKTIVAQVSVSEEEISSSYSANLDSFTTPAQVNVQQIQICFKGAAYCETNQTMDEAGTLVGALMQKIKDGADFTELAVQYSDDTTAKTNKGYTGYFAQEELASQFEDYGKLAFSLSINETAFTKSSFGFFIIKLIDKKEMKITTLDEARNKIKQSLLQYKQSAVYATYISQLLNAADVQIVTPLSVLDEQQSTSSSGNYAGTVSVAEPRAASGPSVESISVE